MNIFYNFVRWLAIIFIKPIYRIKIIGKENIITNKPIILCANHSHFLDAFFLAIAYPGEIHFMAKKELINNKFLAYFVNKLGAIPIDRGGNDIKAMKESLKVLKAGKTLGIFPEGTRVKGYDPKNVKSGVAMLGIRGNATFLPCYLDSSYKMFRKSRVIFGEGIVYNGEEKLSQDDYKTYAEGILGEIYKMKEK